MCTVFCDVMFIHVAAGVAGSELLSCLVNSDVRGISPGAGGASGAGCAGGAVVVVVAGIAGVAAAGLMPSWIRSLEVLVLVHSASVGISSLAGVCCVTSCHWPGGVGWPGGGPAVGPAVILNKFSFKKWPGGGPAAGIWPGGGPAVGIWPGGGPAVGPAVVCWPGGFL